MLVCSPFAARFSLIGIAPRAYPCYNRSKHKGASLAITGWDGRQTVVPPFFLLQSADKKAHANLISMGCVLQYAVAHWMLAHPLG